MLNDARRLMRLIPAGARGQWVFIVCLAVMGSVVEALGTIMILSLLAILTGATEGSQLPFIGGMVRVLPGENGVDLLPIFGGMVGVFFILRGVVLLSQAYLQFRVAENTGGRLSRRLVERYLSMPYEFHLERHSSELIRNALNSVERFVQEGLIPGVRAISKVALVLGIVVVLLVVSPLVTALALAVLAPALVLLLRVIQPRVKRYGMAVQDSHARNFRALQHSLGGIRDVILLGKEDRFTQEFHESRMGLARALYLYRTSHEIPRVLIETGLVLCIVALSGALVWTNGDVEASIPILGLFGYAAMRLMPELNHIATSVNSMRYVGSAISDIQNDLSMVARSEFDGSTAPLAVRKSIAFEDVYFTYPGAMTPALKGINFTLRSGESVGIIGPTGGGKSTIVDVLVGLLTPSNGRVLVDGVDIRRHVRSWQASLGVVSQQVFLTADSIRSNIAMGIHPEEVDEDALREAVVQAQLYEFVESLPEGLDTLVGEHGVRLSGGQRQRISIARALYRRPAVLILDEGTSALDNETESFLLEAVGNLKLGKTVITVAHRLSTVTSCDKVLLVRNGRVYDEGTYVELAGRHDGFGLAGDGEPRGFAGRDVGM